MLFDPHHIYSFLIPVAHAAEEAANSEAASGGVLGTLGINWKLFVAQLINFGIILGVLWKFVFIPVAKKLGERTDKIEKAMNDADRITREKQEFTQWRENEITKARSQASAILTAAESEANKVKQQISDQTKQDQQKLVEQAKTQIEQEKLLAISSAKEEIASMITGAAEKILRKKLDEKADKELIKESLLNIK